MKKELTEKLLVYIRLNNPDLLVQLEENKNVSEYLSAKINSAISLMEHLKDEPDYIFEDAVMELLTQDLRPSKYNYINDILEEEFEDQYKLFREAGVLRTEVINMLHYCNPVFEELHFTEENEDNNFLRLAIIGAIGIYLESNQ